MGEVNALLVFCEGAHDIAFVQQVLKLCLGFTRKQWKLSEHPAPFDQLFSTSVKNHAAQDLSLDMARKFFLPDSVWQKDQDVILLFNSGGSTQNDKVKALLAKFLILFDQRAVFAQPAGIMVNQARYLFLYDADDVGATAWFSKIKQDFAIIDDGPSWVFGEWAFLPNNPFGAIAGDKAAYIWGEVEHSGTLEDLLLPMFETEQQPLMQASCSFVDSAFSWDVEGKGSKGAIAEMGKRKKAIITCAGQRQKPGSPMSAILDQAKLITKSTLTNNSHVKLFVEFMEKFMELT
ncbi:MAG: hypothetical protein PHU14_00745 [Methylovulum sp.]|nr:hypothetical protein [Methylovulum sp.]